MDKTNKDLIKGSLILLITFNLFNVINFFFQFAMARMLTPADYGLLAALFSIIYLTGIFSDPIQTVITKYSAVEKDNGKIKNLVQRAIKKSIKFSSIIFIAYLFLAIPLSLLLKIPYLLLSSTGLMIFAAFLPPITRGAMQGRKRFFSLGFNLLAEAVIKISLAIFLVLIGWSVAGAIAATIIAAFAAFALSFLVIKDILRSRESFMQVKEIYSYSWPVFFVIFSVMVFMSIDIIMARIVFDAATAGNYAIASTLAKIIFIGTQPISKAMFPIAAERKKTGNHSLIINSIALVLTCVLVSLLVFYFFPDYLVIIFSGKYLPAAINIIFYLAMGTSLLSLTSLTLLYKLSTGRMSNYLLFMVFPLIEAALLLTFSHNLIEFSLAFVTANAIFLWGSILLLER